MKSIQGQSRPQVKPNRTNRSPAHGGLVMRPVARAWLGNISESTEARLEKIDPDFPKRAMISPGLSGYFVDELEAYLATLRERRDSGEVPAAVLSGQRLGQSGKGGRPRKAVQLEAQLLPPGASDQPE